MKNIVAKTPKNIRPKAIMEATLLKLLDFNGSSKVLDTLCGIPILSEIWEFSFENDTCFTKF